MKPSTSPGDLNVVTPKILNAGIENGFIDPISPLCYNNST
jgi:hypothetical protein